MRSNKNTLTYPYQEGDLTKLGPFKRDVNGLETNCMSQTDDSLCPDHLSRLELLEASVIQINEKLDEIIRTLEQQREPLRIMKTHVHNVESVAQRIPFARRLQMHLPQQSLGSAFDA